MRVFSLVCLCYSKVSNFDVSIAVKYQVFWLDISVYNLVGVDVLKRGCQTCHNKSCLILIEIYSLANMESEIASRHDIAHQVDIVMVLESIHHIDNEWVSQLRQKLSLSNN